MNLSPLSVPDGTVIPRSFPIVFSEASKNAIHKPSVGMRTRTLLDQSNILKP